MTRTPVVAAAATVATGILLVAAACTGGGTDDPAAFCGALRSATQATGSIDSLDLGDQDSIDAAMAEFDELVELAPSAIGDDVSVVADVYRELVSRLATTAPAARGDVLRDLQPRLDEAAGPAARLERFGQDTCGVTFTGPTQPTPTPTPLDIDD